MTLRKKLKRGLWPNAIKEGQGVKRLAGLGMLAGLWPTEAMAPGDASGVTQRKKQSRKRLSGAAKKEGVTARCVAPVARIVNAYEYSKHTRRQENRVAKGW